MIQVPRQYWTILIAILKIKFPLLKIAANNPKWQKNVQNRWSTCSNIDKFRQQSWNWNFHSPRCTQTKTIWKFCLITQWPTFHLPCCKSVVAHLMIIWMALWLTLRCPKDCRTFCNYIFNRSFKNPVLNGGWVSRVLDLAVLKSSLFESLLY